MIVPSPSDRPIVNVFPHPSVAARAVVAPAALLAVVLPATLAAPALAAQQPSVARLVAEPARLVLQAGDSVPFKVTAYDAEGKVVPDAVVRVGGQRRALLFADGQAKAFQAGTFKAVATAAGAPGAEPVTLEIPVTVTWPALSRLEIVPAPGRLY